MWLFVLFIAIPLIEIALFIQIGGFLGLWPTLAIVVLTAFAGTMLVRSQGLAAITEIQSKISGFRDPTEALAHGAMILAAGLLLLTPGFFTDAVGLSLLLPPVRRAIYVWAKSRINIQTVPPAQQPHSAPDDPIEGEFHEINTDGKIPGTSKWTRD